LTVVGSYCSSTGGFVAQSISIADLIAGYFEVDMPNGKATRFVEDLGFDSIEMYELVVLLEDATGQPIDPDLYGDIRTFEDCERLVSDASARADSDG
jgi:acyl carrier protein